MWIDGMFNIFLWGGDLGKNRKANVARYKNNTVFQNTVMRLIGDALERYKFDGLPESISERVLLQSLLWYGCAVFFEKDGGLIALPACPNGGNFNIYGDPGKVWAFARNGQMNKDVTVYIPGADETPFLRKGNAGVDMDKDYKGVLVWENKVRYPFMRQVMFFADAIADSMRTLDTARANIKSPYIVVAEESVVSTVREFFNKRDNNEDVIVSTGVFPVDKVSILPVVQSGDNLNACVQLIEWYESKFRELCGVQSNSQIDKKGENLIRDEIHVNDEYEFMSVDKCVSEIQKHLDYVNKFFGTHITVKEKGYENKNILSDETGANGLSDNDTGSTTGDNQ